MTPRTSESSHRGAGSMPVPATPLVTQQEEEVVLHDGPDIHSEQLGMNVVSNADVGQERPFIGPIESVLIRGRGTNRAVNAQSVGLTLTQMAPPWPNVNAPADLPARHGSAERETQQSNVANQSTAEDEKRPLRRSGNRTRSPARQPTYAPTTFSEKLQLLEDCHMASEAKQ